MTVTPIQHKVSDIQYIGRFAPSPSGPLHMGSLACALASYLDAKHHQGKWLVRIEDIDPPREPPGTSDDILSTLISHGLIWDDEVCFQSKRSQRYLSALESLRSSGLLYYCTCTRKRLTSLDKAYDGHCRAANYDSSTPSSIRINLEQAHQHTGISHRINVKDGVQISTTEDLAEDGDFIVHRKDGLFAYQLAVVCDDIHQGITHIVRGCDLYSCTSKQIFLTRLMQGAEIQYCHIPVLCFANGNKLSKQNHAPGIDSSRAEKNLIDALTYLQQSPPAELAHASTEEILTWGAQHWDITKLSSQEKILV